MSVETLGVDLRQRTKQLGTKDKARRKKCDVRFSLIGNNRIFQRNDMRAGVRKQLRTGFHSRESVVRTSRGPRAQRKVHLEEADGGSSRREGIGVALIFHGSEQSGS